MDKNGDVFAATGQYRRSPGGRLLRVKRHMCHLSPFMTKDEHDLASPPGDQEDIDDDLAGPMNQGPEQPLVQDEVEEEEYHDALED